MAVSSDKMKVEADLRNAAKMFVEGMLLTRWLQNVQSAFARQGVSTIADLDLTKIFCDAGMDLVVLIRYYYLVAEIAADRNEDVMVVNFAKEVLKKQLTELGAEPRMVRVGLGSDEHRWLFVLRPGEEPNLSLQ